jgi:hypothetical protein
MPAAGTPGEDLYHAGRKADHGADLPSALVRAKEIENQPAVFRERTILLAIIHDSTLRSLVRLETDE